VNSKSIVRVCFSRLKHLKSHNLILFKIVKTYFMHVLVFEYANFQRVMVLLFIGDWVEDGHLSYHVNAREVNPTICRSVQFDGISVVEVSRQR
jgi:hypothetical protein